MANIESISLIIGSLLGGFIGYLDSSYSTNLLILSCIEAFSIVLALYFVKKKYETIKTRENKTGISPLFLNIKSSKTLITIFLMLAITGMVLATVETYWQTTLLQYLPQDLKWLLGCTNCFAYIGVLIGNYICTRMYTNKTLLPLTNIQYYLLKLLLPLPLHAISLSSKWLWFVLFYLLLYIALGFVNLIENTLIHTNVKSSQRASILSMYSLFSMGGGFAASLITSLILKEYTLACVWSTISVISILSTVLICLAVNKRISGKDLHMAE